MPTHVKVEKLLSTYGILQPTDRRDQFIPFVPSEYDYTRMESVNLKDIAIITRPLAPGVLVKVDTHIVPWTCELGEECRLDGIKPEVVEHMAVIISGDYPKHGAAYARGNWLLEKSAMIYLKVELVLIPLMIFVVPMLYPWLGSGQLYSGACGTLYIMSRINDHKILQKGVRDNSMSIMCIILTCVGVIFLEHPVIFLWMLVNCYYIAIKSMTSKSSNRDSYPLLFHYKSRLLH